MVDMSTKQMQHEWHSFKQNILGLPFLESSSGMHEGGEIEVYLKRMFQLLYNLLCAQPQYKAH